MIRYKLDTNSNLKRLPRVDAGMHNSTPNLHDIHLRVLGKIARLDHLVCKYQKNEQHNVQIIHFFWMQSETEQKTQKRDFHGFSI